MRVPVVRGVIARRLLVNYRVDPAALAAILPSPFRPKRVGEYGMAGICLIRLAEIRPRGLPAAVGIGSENAAHRIAVEWDEHGVVREGVYIPRRDTDSQLNTLLGGRLLPGRHQRARFRVREEADRFSVTLESMDGQTRVGVVARVAPTLPASSVFRSLEAASEFFEAASLGYSATERPGEYEGLELQSHGWRVEPLAVDQVTSSYFEDAARFPPGTVTFDSALLMRGVPHEWHARPSIWSSSTARHVASSQATRNCTKPSFRRAASHSSLWHAASRAAPLAILFCSPANFALFF